MLRCFKKLKCLKVRYGANSADFAAGWQHIAHLLLKTYHCVTRKISFTDPEDKTKIFLRLQYTASCKVRQAVEQEQEFMHLTLDNYWMKGKNIMLKLCPSILILQSCLSQALTSILPEVFMVIQKSVLQNMSFPSNVISVNLCTPEIRIVPIINTEIWKKFRISLVFVCQSSTLIMFPQWSDLCPSLGWMPQLFRPLI